MKKLTNLSWRARGSGLRAPPKSTIRFADSGSNQSTGPTLLRSLAEGSPPTVSWISFDGDTYWVGLAVAQGWPRSIRITQSDVDGARE